ncbi:MAG TPA: ATP-binding protein [Albitalea sp.]|uniref:ATP-binding protein n=1 Tax=Piscinibacter sp. TaxID=1903157 RepID=UPI002ED120D7
MPSTANTQPESSRGQPNAGMSEQPSRPIDPALHPIEVGNHRVATPAIQAFNDLVNRCLRFHVTGALIYGPSRVGKTCAIEYLRMLLAETQPRIATLSRAGRAQATPCRRPVLREPVHALGYADPDGGTNSAKRRRVANKIKEEYTRRCGGTVVLFCDEEQRYDENEYEWLRDLHDQLDRLQIRLYTFLVGQQELLTLKTTLQQAHKTQIVARLMVEQLAFFGVRNVRDVATCLDGYDKTCFPRGSDWSFTHFYMPKAVAGGYRLADDAPILWAAFEGLHHKQGLPASWRSRWSPSRARWKSS